MLKVFVFGFEVMGHTKCDTCAAAIEGCCEKEKSNVGELLKHIEPAVACGVCKATNKDQEVHPQYQLGPAEGRSDV